MARSTLTTSTSQRWTSRSSDPGSASSPRIPSSSLAPSGATTFFQHFPTSSQHFPTFPNVLSTFPNMLSTFLNLSQHFSTCFQHFPTSSQHFPTFLNTWSTFNQHLFISLNIPQRFKSCRGNNLPIHQSHFVSPTSTRLLATRMKNIFQAAPTKTHPSEPGRRSE